MLNLKPGEQKRERERKKKRDKEALREKYHSVTNTLFYVSKLMFAPDKETRGLNLCHTIVAIFVSPWRDFGFTAIQSLFSVICIIFLASVKRLHIVLKRDLYSGLKRMNLRAIGWVLRDSGNLLFAGWARVTLQKETTNWRRKRMDPHFCIHVIFRLDKGYLCFHADK